MMTSLQSRVCFRTETFLRGIELKMACFFLVAFVMFGLTAGKPLQKGDERRKDFYFSPKKALEFTLHISEAGEEYKENIEVDPNKRTELFQVPAHPGVDQSDTLRDFKQNLTMLRFPDSKICFIFPLANEHSSPEKLMRDLEKAKQTVITATRRVDTTWIIDSEVSDRSVLSDELAEFCTQYPIYHVREAQETLQVTGIQTEERSSRTRRQITARGLNTTELCHGAMDLYTAHQKCADPEKKIREYHSCIKYVECDGRRIGRLSHHVSDGPGCSVVHGSGLIVCYEYVCNIASDAPRPQGSGQGSGEGPGGPDEGPGGPDEESGERPGVGSGDVLERL